MTGTITNPSGTDCRTAEFTVVCSDSTDGVLVSASLTLDGVDDEESRDFRIGVPEVGAIWINFSRARFAGGTPGTH